MIVHRCKQGGEEWHELRRGKPTASVFKEIITPKTLALSKQSTGLRNRLLTERFTGLPLESFTSAAMDHGRENEPKARAWYEMAKSTAVARQLGRYGRVAHGVEVEQVGICFTDDGRVGASPDGLVGRKGGIEIKCPGGPAHLTYWFGDTGAYADYKAQIQGQIWVCELDWIDSVSWCPPFPVKVHRHWRDEEFIAALAEAVGLFLGDLEYHEALLVQAGAVYLGGQTSEVEVETEKRDATFGWTDEEAAQVVKDLMRGKE